MNADQVYEAIKKAHVKEEHEELSWTGSFRAYLDMFMEHPEIARSAYQRLYEMIASYGSRSYV
jgi:serine protein kinase